MKKIFFVTLFCLLGFVPKGFTFDYSHFPPLPENPNPSYYTEVAGSGDPTYFYAFFCYVHNKDAWILPHASSNGFTYLEHPALQLTGTIDDMVCWHKPYDSTEWLQPQSFWYAGATSVDYYYALQLPVDSYFFSSFDLKSASNASFNGNYGLYDVNAGDTLLTANYQTTLQLTIARSPEAGGGVASLSGEETQPNCEAEDGLFCGTCGHNYCVGSAPSNSTVKFGAFPNSGYAFAYWSWNAGGSSSTANPEIFTLSGDLGLVAVFKPVLQFPLTGTLEQRGTPLLSFGGDWTHGQCPTGTDEIHIGLDLQATAGEEVYAAHTGTVKEIFTGEHSQWADAIVVESSDNQYTTVYWHVIKYGNLAVNDTVTKGQQIATIANLNGDTHFHFGIRMASFVAGISDKGALPASDCSGKPAFPEHFINPVNITYE